VRFIESCSGHLRRIAPIKQQVFGPAAAAVGAVLTVGDQGLRQVAAAGAEHRLIQPSPVLDPPLREGSRWEMGTAAMATTACVRLYCGGARLGARGSALAAAGVTKHCIEKAAVAAVALAKSAHNLAG